MKEDGDNPTVVDRYFHPDVVVSTTILTGSLLGLYFTFNRYLRSYKRASDIPKRAFHKKWLYGKVTAVGDGDNFHFFHTPGGILGGWRWLRKVPTQPKNNIPTEGSNMSKNILKLVARGNSKKFTSEYFMSLPSPYKNLRSLPTIPVRLCGIDAPERAHFGSKTQAFGDEALHWLSHRLLGRYVWIKPLSVDQYNRCVAKVVYLSWTGWKNVSIEMLQQGLAVVYESESSGQFDNEKMKYQFYESISKTLKRGLWNQKKLVTPGEFKKKNKIN